MIDPPAWQKAAVYVTGLALGWALTPTTPKGRPMIPRTVATLKTLALAVMPKRGAALVAKTIGQFDKMIAQLERAAQQIAEQRRAVIDEQNAERERFYQRRRELWDKEDALDVAFDRAMTVRDNISALVAK
jgi:hypothetical protein